MVEISGTYELVSQENIYEYMLSLGYPEDAARNILDEGKTIVLAADSNRVSMESFGKIVDFVYGKVTHETLPNGHPIESVAHLDGNVLVIKTMITKDLLQERVFTFHDSMVEIVVTNSLGVKGKRIYKKVSH